MQESTSDTKAIRILAATTGILTGFGVAYLACFFAESATGPPYFYYDPMVILLQFIVLGIIVFLLWIRKPLSLSDARVFVLEFCNSATETWMATRLAPHRRVAIDGIEFGLVYSILDSFLARKLAHQRRISMANLLLQPGDSRIQPFKAISGLSDSEDKLL